MKLTQKTIGSILRENARQYGDHDAVIYHDLNLRYNWSQLDQLVDTAAKGFLALGLKMGDHIAIWGTNVPIWLITQLAAARIGAVLVTINPEWKEQELAYSLKQSDTKYLVMIPGFTKKSKKKSYHYDYSSMLSSICPETQNTLNEKKLHCQALPTLRKIIVDSQKPLPGMMRWNNLLSLGEKMPMAKLEKVTRMVRHTDTAMIQYTSGTTGFPKGTMLSHFNIVNNALIASNNMLLSQQDKLCGPVPYHHCFGSILVNLCCLVTSATMVIPAPIFNAIKTLEAVEQYRCTALHGVPTMFLSVLDEKNFDSFNLSSLRTGIIAGAPVDRELMVAINTHLGAREMTIGYGLTEASPITHQTLPEDTLERRVSTVGKPIELTEAKIVEPSTLEELPLGEVGEIWVKGFHVMKGYYKKPKETAEAIIDGWLRTGDLANVDAQGYYRIVGRLKNMIIVGGHNVYPAEVEQQLHSLLEDKIELIQVVGIPHSKLQEVVAAVAKCHPGKTLTLKELQKRVEGKIEWSKIPRELKIIQDFTPYMTGTGKLQKFKLKALFVKKSEPTYST